MKRKQPILAIALQAPWSLGDCGGSRFAALFLLALAVARRAGHVGVPAHDLHFAGQAGSAFPMALSRAFKQFSRAGIAVGWGRNTGADIATLSLRGRIHGPFWLADGELERLKFSTNGRAVAPASLKSLLCTITGAAAGSTDVPAHADLEARLDRWIRVFVLRQSAEEGRLAMPEVMDGLSRVRWDASQGRDASQRWALSLQARYARLARQGGEARALYRELHRLCRSPDPVDEHEEFLQRTPVLEAMSEIGLAWCDHQDDRSAAALMRLEQMRYLFEGDASQASLRLSSRLAAEYFNLRALCRRALLLARTSDQRAHDAWQVLRDMQLALVCAVETDSLTLMEAVASNLGYSLWLLAPALQERLGANAGRRLAVRWILTGEALARRHGLGSGSYWNIIYICRIARGAVVNMGEDAGAAIPFVNWSARVWTLQELRSELAQSDGDASDPAGRELRSLCELLLPSSLPDWLTLTTRMLAAVSEDAGDASISAIQRCAAMLEHLWQLVLHDRAVPAASLRRSLESRLASLEVAQRKYFRADLARLPRL
ncbi:hypothetical protein [Diaphorobacter aerolatus]|uniref:Uncharacterized protein n=1 Tax=Diaphorobacter aerolatus TaxID=1288495 RepID=A0A7H0GHZ5_9BURK|nr:hypothetical protein [Diaphorobacter aerolatus]QNP47911.1 hypothetical protein H9K75_17570 [Diaphorobacter aerolatus]